ncbi:histidine kinase [Chryseobacterium sp. Leaf404]|uniref:2TM domain-containing protein n=1 Tax=unclassified Chryseobacterium TaxID=2593645 RepID=UPI0007006FCB|nr:MULTISPECIES: 2TM domain-containing protein [unclassified Chryseobacterium]KQT22225.1 histidine kinase [Chryseobacterium sp. Leaf404]
MEEINSNNYRYQQAKKQVDRLRGFYGHLFSYIAVNILIVFINYNNLNPGESYFQFKNFITATFWGIGLLIHALFVFFPRFSFFRNWEEKKIKELMEKNNKNGNS